MDTNIFTLTKTSKITNLKTKTKKNANRHLVIDLHKAEHLR